MDSAARDRLVALVRGEVRVELAAELELLAGLAEREDQAGRVDRLAGELDEARYRLALVEQQVGLTSRKPRGAVRRRHAVIELRRAGHSLRAISVLLNLARHTVERDLADANVSLPPDARGVDGRAIGARASNGTRASA